MMRFLSRCPELILTFLVFFSLAAAPLTPPEPLPEDPALGKYATLPPAGPEGVTTPYLREAVAPDQTTAGDNFGYTWDDSVPFTWIDAASGGSEVSFPGSDDSTSDAIDIGFDFKFYENTYSQLYVDTNGLIRFAAGQSYMVNASIPDDAPPNGYIAPFWADLAVGGENNSGKIYYRSGTAGSVDYLAVEWLQVTRLNGGENTLTFEAVLYANGNILFQYLDLNGDLASETIGIEDADGIDGLSYLYQSTGLVENKAVLFQRPAPTNRVKALSTYASSFTLLGRTLFPVTVRNTGDSLTATTDTYELSAASSNPAWTVSLVGEDGLSLLADSNGNGTSDTGALAQGAERVLTVKCTAPGAAQIGDYAQVTLTIRSSRMPSRQTNVTLQAAIPASFAQASTNEPEGVFLGLRWENNDLTARPMDYFPGRILALASRPQKNFIYAWERSGTDANTGQPYTDLELAVFDRFGGVVQPAFKLTNHAAERVRDQQPALAVAPDGRIGVAWVRNERDSSNRIKSNVYFTLLSSVGQTVVSPVNLTQNTDYVGSSDIGKPVYQSPRITATSDNRFMLAWVDKRHTTSDETFAVEYAAFSSSGSVLHPAGALTPSGTLQYYDPALAELSSGRVFVAYTIYDPASETDQIAYVVLDSSGGVQRGETELAGAQGKNTDVIQLSNGRILAAWSYLASNKIGFAVLDDSSFDLLAVPTDLTNPIPRQAEYVSVSADTHGNGILTWMDSILNHELFYALIGPSGEVKTPAMVFYSNPSSVGVITSYAGQGNAPYDGAWSGMLPFIYQR